MVARICILLVLAFGAACDAGFESPDRVVDLRILAIRAEPPEVLIPEDFENIDLSTLPAVQICSLVADPGQSRGLSYDFSACAPSGNLRCENRIPSANLGSGSVEDPEESQNPVEICERILPSPALLEVLQRSVTLDTLQGFGAIDVQVQSKIWPEGNNLDQAIFASKSMRFGIAIPAERTPNRNPSLQAIRVARDSTGPRGRDFDLPIGRCTDIEPILVSPSERLMLLPMEAADTREEYVVPTLDGDVERYSENIRYQFYATAGGFSPFTTGGTRDIVGNEPTLHSYWRAPSFEDLMGETLNVSLWVIQRDERGGQAWYESCARVVPDGIEP
jgi:hypothetical protein